VGGGEPAANAATGPPTDPGSADVYDARSGGGFPIPTPPIPCEGDACQPLPNAPEDPTVGTLIPGPGNPPVHFPKVVHKCPKGKRSIVRHGKAGCVPNHHKGRHHKRAHRRAARNPGGRK
jgi:hypothetical protein